jgi:hypothetical protein
MDPRKMTICGGGNGAQTLLPIAARSLDCPVDLYAPFADEAERLQAGLAVQGCLRTTGAVEAQARPRCISHDPAQVIPGSDLIVLVLPAFAHEPTLRQIAPFVEPGAWIGAVPARGGFDYAAFSTLQKLGRTDIRLFGLQTLPWACRVREYGQKVDILGIKDSVAAASRPANRYGEIAPLLERMLGMPVPNAGNFLALTLANTGQLIHPGIMYALFARWDGAPLEAPPLFYQGLDKEGARTLAGLSDDVQRLRHALTGRLDLSAVRPLLDWLTYSYGQSIGDASTLRSAFVTNQAYAGLRAPMRQVGPDRFVPDFSARYLAEDIPFGLAVTRAVARLAQVATPTIDRVLSWASDRLGRDFLGRDAALARIPQNYGLTSLEQLIAFATEEPLMT